MPSRLRVKNFVAGVITIAVAIVAAAFVCQLLGIDLPILSDITQAMGLPAPGSE